MKAVVKKWGNSASVRIPAAVLQAAKLRLDDSVDVREESGRIVIEPAPRREYPGEFARGSRFWQTRGQRGLVMPPAYVPDAGDIVWINFDPQAGHEQAGHRSAVVLSPAAYN
jgi:hypothetical protein